MSSISQQSSSSQSSSTDPWTPYADKSNGKGHGHGHPVVPEPELYGAGMALLMFAVLARKKWVTRRNKG